jgi:hypothetical protein
LNGSLIDFHENELILPIYLSGYCSILFYTSGVVNMENQNEITEASDLFTEEASLLQRGWARKVISAL